MKKILHIIGACSAGIVLGVLVLAGVSQLTSTAQVVRAQNGTDVVTITYQGRLRTNEGYVSDSCDIRFTLWGTENQTNRLAGPITRTGVTVQDGFFVVDLDFERQAILAPERYLQLGFRCGADTFYTDLNTLQKLNASPTAYQVEQASATWETLSSTLPAGFVDGEDNTISYEVGVGLAKQFIDFTNGITVERLEIITSVLYNTNTVQARVTQVCRDDETMVNIKPDGTVTCAPARINYVAGEGLEIIPNPQQPDNPILEYDAGVVQGRGDPTNPATFCPPDYVIRTIEENGSVTCQEVIAGEIVEFSGGAGIAIATDSEGNSTVRIRAGGIISAMLADGIFDGPKFADGAVDNNALADDAINHTQIQTQTIGFDKINRNGCNDAQVLRWDPSPSVMQWRCTASAPLVEDNGIDVTGNVISVRPDNDSVTFNGDSVAVQFGNIVGQVITVATVPTQPARFDHTHPQYIPLEQDITPSNDVTGNYTAGFRVRGISSTQISGLLPGNDKFITFDNSNNPSFTEVPLVLSTTTTVTDIADFSMACPATYAVIGGGCDCDGLGANSAYPSNATTFRCVCDLSTGNFEGYALCLKTQ